MSWISSADRRGSRRQETFDSGTSETPGIGYGAIGGMAMYSLTVGPALEEPLVHSHRLTFATSLVQPVRPALVEARRMRRTVSCHTGGGRSRASRAGAHEPGETVDQPAVVAAYRCRDRRHRADSVEPNRQE